MEQNKRVDNTARESAAGIVFSTTHSLCVRLYTEFAWQAHAYCAYIYVDAIKFAPKCAEPESAERGIEALSRAAHISTQIQRALFCFEFEKNNTELIIINIQALVRLRQL
jgi:hypothetical protein